MLPALADVVGDLGKAPAVIAVQSAYGGGEARGGFEQLAVDVELRLLGGVVSDPNGAGLAIARQGE